MLKKIGFPPFRMIDFRLFYVTQKDFSLKQMINKEQGKNANKDKTADGLYHFPLDLSDSTAVYDVSFFSRIDCTRSRLASIEDFPMTVLWTSPSGVKYSEKVFFPVSSYAGSSGFYSHQYRIPYRTGIVPERTGVWDMAVRIESDRYIPGFRGLGVVCKKRL